MTMRGRGEKGWGGGEETERKSERNREQENRERGSLKHSIMFLTPWLLEPGNSCIKAYDNERIKYSIG